jgi:hypothetical protein
MLYGGALGRRQGADRGESGVCPMPGERLLDGAGLVLRRDGSREVRWWDQG